MKQRRREVGCFPAHAAEAAGEGFRSDAEAWRDEANELKVAPVALRWPEFVGRDLSDDLYCSVCVKMLVMCPLRNTLAE